MAASSDSRQAKAATGSTSGYHLVHQDEGDGNYDSQRPPPMPPVMPRGPNRPYHALIAVLSGLVVVLLAGNIYLSLPYAFRRSGSDTCPCKPPDVPQYFQTSPQLWAGATATGKPAFMAQTRIFEPTNTYVPNEPLQTSIPIEGMKEGNQSIFKMMGFLSPYSPSPGFGVDEYPIPEGAEIVQVQMLSRHGSRYPTPDSAVAALGQRLANQSGTFTTNGHLAFLMDWKYELGHAILVPRGREELFQSGKCACLLNGEIWANSRLTGVLHSYMYGSLYNPESKIIVRTTVCPKLYLWFVSY